MAFAQIHIISAEIWLQHWISYVNYITDVHRETHKEELGKRCHVNRDQVRTLSPTVEELQSCPPPREEGGIWSLICDWTPQSVNVTLYRGNSRLIIWLRSKAELGEVRALHLNGPVGGAYWDGAFGFWPVPTHTHTRSPTHTHTHTQSQSAIGGS